MPAAFKEYLPTVTIEAIYGGRVLAEAKVPGGPKAIPEKPALADLEVLSWSRGALGPDAELFLYAPDTRYAVQTTSYCGAYTGSINAAANHWGLYRSTKGGAPERLLEIGETSFEGGRGMKAETAADAGTTFLFLGQYGSCANPTWYEIYAYDHATGEAYRPQMKREDGKVSNATAGSFALSPDGKLTSRSYNNADSVGRHTYIYTWDRTVRMWVFQAHIKGQ